MGLFNRFDVITSDFDTFGRKSASLATLFGGNRMMKEFLEDAGEYVLDMVMLQFVSEGANQGTPWQPLSIERQDQRSDAGLNPTGPILIGETERLINSWHWDWISNNTIIVGMFDDMESGYGGANQLGDARRPARPMLVVDSEMINTLNQMFEDYMDHQVSVMFPATGTMKP